MSAESDSFSADSEPTRALLLAQALEACIEAERSLPGSADQVIARQPAWARAELRRLVALAGSLDAAATSAVMSEEFRSAARARLMRRISPTLVEDHLHAVGGHARRVSPEAAWLTPVPSRNGHHAVKRRRRLGWLWRGGLGGLVAAALVVPATVTASASALPGEPLYSVKQVREEIGLRFAPDDQARTLALLNQADARLDETARLLQSGRTDHVAMTTQRFDDVLDRAAATYVVTIADAQPSDATTNAAVADTLNRQQQELQNLLNTAPEPAQADLREALVVTERSRALLSDPTPTQRAARPASPAAAAAPTVAPEVQPTQVARSVPPPVDLVPQPTPAAFDAAQDRHEGRGIARDPVQQDQSAAVTAPTVVVVTNNRGSSGRSPVTLRQNGQLEDVQVTSGPVVAVQGGGGQDDQSSGQSGDGPRASDPGPGPAADGQSGSDDRVVAPSQNQGDGHARVAEQPAATTTTAAVAQRQGSGNGRTSATTAVAQDFPGGGRNASARDNGDDGHGGSQPAPTPGPSTARAQATPSSGSASGDHRGDATSAGGGSGSSGGSTRSGSSASGQSGFGQSGSSASGQSGFGQSGFGQSGFGQSGSSASGGTSTSGQGGFGQSGSSQSGSGGGSSQHGDSGGSRGH
jgi:hypothetical protein